MISLTEFALSDKNKQTQMIIESNTEIYRLKQNYERIYNENCKLRKEHNIDDIKLLDENYNLTQRINKAIELLNEYKDVCVMTYLNDDTYKTTSLYEDLKKVLEGEDKK